MPQLFTKTGSTGLQFTLSKVVHGIFIIVSKEVVSWLHNYLFPRLHLDDLCWEKVSSSKG